MAHHSRVRGSGDAWASILPSELASLDALLRACVNGVDGGAYAPAGLITIGGSGLVCSGPLTVARGGTLVSSNGTLQFSPSIFPQLSATHSGRTRTVMYPFAAARPNLWSIWRPRRDSSGMQAIAPTFTTWQNPGVVRPASLSLPIRAVQGATVSQITIGFRVGYPHSAIPGALPSARLLRVDKNGNAVPCTSVASGADANGWVYVPKPSSSAAWFNLGAAQSFVLPCDQNNVVDRTQYTYRLEVQDEQGLTGWPWQVAILAPCRLCSFGTQVIGTSFAQLNGSTGYDSITANVGDRILVINTIGQQETGIYVQGASGIARAQDFQQASQFSQGILVGVQQGHNFAGTYWQASASIQNWTPGTTPLFTGGQGAQFWQASTAYVSGASANVVLPQTPSGSWFKCTTSGTSGSGEPAWPTQAGATVSDGSVVWTNGGNASTPLPWVTRPDADQVTLGLAMSHYGTIFESAAVMYTNITRNAFE